MSCCKNCGVSLAPTEVCCPLCGTPAQASQAPAYSLQEELCAPFRMDKPFWTRLALWLCVPLFPLIMVWGLALCLCKRCLGKTNFLLPPVFSILLLAATVMGAETGIDLLCSGSIRLCWSLYALIPLGLMGMVLLLAFCSKRLQNLLHRNFFL